MSVIARELGVGAYALRREVERLYRGGAQALAYTKTAKASFMYDVEAVRHAVAPCLAELRARWAAHNAKRAEAARRRAESMMALHPRRVVARKSAEPDPPIAESLTKNRSHGRSRS